MSISASCRKLWQQANHQHLWEIPNYISSQMHIKHHLLSTATNSNKRFTSERPHTKHTLLYARKPPGFHLSSPSCSLSLSVSWHSRAVSQVAPHAPNENPPTALKPQRKWEDELEEWERDTAGKAKK